MVLVYYYRYMQFGTSSCGAMLGNHKFHFLKSRSCMQSGHPYIMVLLFYFQVHFRGYPSNTLIPCEGEDSVKWSFINSLKEVCSFLTIF